MYISMEDERTKMMLVAILLVGSRRTPKDFDQAIADADVIFKLIQEKSEV